MNDSLINILVDPKNGKKLYKVGNQLLSEDGQTKIEIVNDVPRFVPDSNYADNFGMQWNHFSKTQLDSHSNQPISYDRFWSSTRWNKDDLKSKLVLDVGCGSGRFAEVALNAGAFVVALDYSSAVDSCYNNLRNYPNLLVIQADVYQLPFAENTFDFIYSLGVLQHTPNVEKAFAALIPPLKSGGKICVDFYEKSFKSILLPKYWLRPLTKKMDKRKLFIVLENRVEGLMKLSRFLSSVPYLGNLLKRLVPVANYDGVHPLNETQIFEWALLDTFDWLSPEYDNPQNSRTVRKWCETYKLNQIEVEKIGHLVGRGVK
jgi:ubiquinone/menaquinone biosynthesis C-methylase UbiE